MKFPVEQSLEHQAGSAFADFFGFICEVGHPSEAGGEHKFLISLCFSGFKQPCRPASDGWCFDWTMNVPCPPAKNTISQYPWMPMVLSALYENSARVFHKVALTAIASSVTNITSTGHDVVMFDG